MRRNKMKTIKNTFRLFLAVCCLLFASCDDKFNLPGDSDITIPEGMGYVRLTVKTQNERSIVPGAVIGDFLSYKLEFTNLDNSDHNINILRTKASLSDPVLLEPGNYDLLITAYMGASQTNPAASGNASLTILLGSGLNETVTLLPFTNTGSGTFRWNITIPAALGVNSANMTITPLSANGTAEQTVNISTTPTGTRTLNSSYYSVIFTFTKTNNETVIWRDILHIYQNMESRFDYTFTEAHLSSINYLVTYIYNNGVIINGTENILRGSNLNEPTAPTWNKGTFEGWYTDSALTNKVTFPYNVTGDITLYAKWEADSGFNINWDYTDSRPILFSSKPVEPDTETSILRGSSVIFTVINAPSFDSGSIKWYCGDVVVGIGAIFTFDTSEERFNRTGVILLTIEADKDGVRYSTHTSVNVVQANIVTFDADNGTSFTYQYVTVGNKVEKIADPVKAQPPKAAGLYLTVSGEPASVFEGWYNGSTLFDFDTTILGDIVLKAEWSDPSPIIDVPASGETDYDYIEKSFSYVNTATNASKGSYTLYLNNTAQESISARTLNAANARLTIADFGNPNAERVIKNSGTSSLITISSSTASLTLGKNITLMGGDTNSTTFLVSVSGGTFNMQEGSKITGHKTNVANGAVSISSGTFNMSGGEITGNRTTNSTTSASGGVILSSGTFNMSGGKIHGNIRNYTDGAPLGIPVDVYVSSTTAGALTLSGNAEPGVITLNSASSSSSFSSVTLNRWTGLAELNLRKDDTLDSVPGFWEFKQIVRAASGYTLTAQDISRITLGNFLSSATTDNSSSAFNTHNIAGGQMNAILGTLMPINAQKPVMGTQPVGTFYIKGCNFRTPLTVSASLNDGGLLSYQWYSYTEDDSIGGAIPINGGTPVGVNSARYVPDILDKTMYYYCVISNKNVLSVGDQLSEKTTSNAACIEVRDLSEATVFIDFIDTEGIELKNIPFLDLNNALRLFTASTTVFVTPPTSPSYPELQNGNYTFRIKENQPIAGQSLNSYSLLNYNKDIVFIADDPSKPVEIQPSGSSYFLYLYYNFTLDNGITIKGRKDESTNNSSSYPLIYVSGTLNMKDGSKITGHKNTSSSVSYYGGAVYVAGTLNMSGGEISENVVTAGEGGGVYIASSGKINIGGNAKIIDNLKETGGVPVPNNLSLFYGRSIEIGNAAVPLPSGSMQVGVSGLGTVATNSTGYTSYFIKDDINFNLVQEDNNLMLRPLVGSAVIVDMRDSYGDGWDGSGALRINVNGTDIASNVKVNSSYNNIYILFVNHDDLVQFYWIAGTAQGENAFIVHYYDSPPNPAFNPTTWTGTNALIHRLYNSMNSITGGTLLGSFTVP